MEGTTMQERTITADMLRRIEEMADGAIIRHDDGTYEARPLHRTTDESHEGFDAVLQRVYIRANGMWDGHDVEGLTDDERYTMLAEHLNAPV